MPSTVEELVALVLSLRAEMETRLAAAEARAVAAEAKVVALEARCARLERENAELRARLGKDSSNSNKPPSSDPPYKAKPPGKKGKRKVGGQPGHEGTTRPWYPPDKVNRRTVLRPTDCACGASLAGLPATQGTWSRQVVEIPAIKPDVTEYVFECLRCPCCARLNAAAVPPEAATCTGPHLTALMATLVGQYHLSRDAAADLLSSVLGLPVCPATVQDACGQLGDALASATADVSAALPSEACVHMDETSGKQRKILHWLWIAVGTRVTSFAVHASRGATQLLEWFPNPFAGVVVCDRMRAYERFERRQLCWSHLDRDFQSVIDFGSAGVPWATRALDGSGRMFDAWHQFKRGEMTRAALQRKTRVYRTRLAAFCALGAGQAVDRRWRGLGRDLLRQWASVFRFLDEEGIEPTNNTAERGLRGGVIWRRGSQGTRTDAGSTFVARIMTAVANCKRQDRHVVAFLVETLLAHRAGQPTPSLVPPEP